MEETRLILRPLFSYLRSNILDQAIALDWWSTIKAHGKQVAALGEEEDMITGVEVEF